MRTLLLSAVLYLLGVAAVLYFRPPLMFQADGTWKEFGVEDKEEHTIFPFWMFCIAWALGTFALISLGEWALGGDVEPAAMPAAAAVATTAAASQVAEPLQPLPPRTRHRRTGGIQTPTGVMQPGYYMLDPAGSGVPGVPRYIYIGPEGPGMPLGASAPSGVAEGEPASDEE